MGQTISGVSLSRKLRNALGLCSIGLGAVCAITPLFLIFGYLISKGAPGLNLAFFTELPQPAGETGGGLSNALTGSLTLTALALLLGVPSGLLTGIALNQLRKTRLGSLLRTGIDLLATVPSIVIGLFVYAVVVVPMGTYSAVSGGVALGLIMTPMIARSTEEILRMVPKHVVEAGLALGLPRWRVLLMIILPGVKAGLSTGVILATARVAGESAPLLFTAFSNSFGFRGLLNPVASLPVQIYQFATSHDDQWRQLAWTAALVLVIVVFFLNLLTRMLIRSRV